ncbi:MAG: AAA family ATPase [Akkermansiaceae bacterium]
MNSNSVTPLIDYLSDTVVGAEEAAKMLVTALLAGGHVLIEGAPGIGKTTLANTLASVMGGMFKRIQFTPDLLPSDLIGYNLYRSDKGSFEFIKGPVFSNCLLADEINRTSPRVQSALLESMNEACVTVDGETHQLPKPFMVIATQNDTHATGTFPLPEPQLDRFLLSLQMLLPNSDLQTKILLDHASRSTERLDKPDFGLDGVAIQNLQEIVESIPISEAVAGYITSLCENLRHLAGSEESVSIRASLALLRASRANAFLDSAPAVYPDHVQAVFSPVMRHRILSENEQDPEELIASTLMKTEVP